MPNRHFSSSDYRYGFNGMEKDDEMKSNGNSYDFGARMYDPRLARWSSVDPIAVKYSGKSPYNAISNNPMTFTDPDGKEIIIHYKGEDGKDKSFNIKPGIAVPNDKFVYSIIKDLKLISTTSEGLEVIQDLISSQAEYHIYATNGVAGRGGPRFEPNVDMEALNNAVTYTEGVKSMQGYSGGKLFMNVNLENKQMDGVSMSTTYVLGHELFHAYQRERGITGYVALTVGTSETGLPMSEVEAVGFENYLRYSLSENSKEEAMREVYSQGNKQAKVIEFHSKEEGILSFMLGSTYTIYPNWFFGKFKANNTWFRNKAGEQIIKGKTIDMSKGHNYSSAKNKKTSSLQKKWNKAQGRAERRNKRANRKGRNNSKF